MTRRRERPTPTVTGTSPAAAHFGNPALIPKAILVTVRTIGYSTGMMTTPNRRVRRVRTDGVRRLVGFLRVSTDRQRLEGESIEAQRSGIEQAAAGMGAVLVGCVTAPEGKGSSGGLELEQDAYLQQALALAFESGASLIVKDLTRLGRNLRRQLNTVHELDRRGLSVISLREGIDTSTPCGKQTAHMFGVMADMQREAIRASTREALAYRREQGRKTGGFAPYGYRAEGGDRRLVADAAEQNALKVMQALRSKGFSYRAVAKHLQESGIPTPTMRPDRQATAAARKGGAWHSMTVKRVLDAAA